ncbi:MAG: Sip1-related alpha-galactosidase [bacterium]|nr:Sip1-related alpha-galactosidase [bacterium]
MIESILKNIEVKINLADGGVTSGKLVSSSKGNIHVIGCSVEPTQIIHPLKGIEFKVGSIGTKSFLGFADALFWSFPVSSSYSNIRLYNLYDDQMLLNWILWKKSNTYGVILPIPTLNMIGRVKINNAGKNLYIKQENIIVNDMEQYISVKMYSGVAEETSGSRKCFILSMGIDPYRVIEDSFQEFKAIMNIKPKRIPPFADYIGWCSWNSFYKKVSAENVYKALDEFKTNKCPVKWLLIDDGWETEEKQQLTSLQVDKKKFPDGLKNFVKKIKNQYGIKYFGIWLPVTGHWKGLSPKIKSAKTYATVQTNRGNFLPPAKSGTFFNDIYSYFRQEGVDFIKVDNLNGLSEHFSFREPLGKVYRTILAQCSKNAEKYLGKNKIMACMNHTLEIMGNLKNCAIFRNSDDYYPENDYIKRTASHIIQNAFNSLWIGQFGVADYDMFFSSHITGELHPILRAVSGGPVYCTDHLGEHDFSILRKFIDKNGKLLKPDGMGLPARDCLFNRLDEYNRVIKIFNKYENTGILAVFNPNDMQKLNYTVKADDVEKIKGDKFIIWSHINKTYHLVTKKQKIKMGIDAFSAELFIIAPITNGLGIIGAVDKYISPAVVKEVKVNNKTLFLKVSAGNEFMLYCDKEIENVYVNNNRTTFKKSKNIIHVGDEKQIKVFCGND